jgi:tetratricopeptide (TPR) repeat protein
LHEHNDAYYNIAYCYFKQEDYQSAAQSFRTFTQDETEFHKEKLTDAFLRIGDCYFVDKDDDNAIIFYNKAITSGGGQTDYAKYQIGLSYGFKQNYPEKASTMLDIVNNHNKSPLVVPALFEVAESYRLMDKNKYPDAKNKAMRYYNQLIQDHPNHSLVVDAVFQIGLLQFTAKEYNQAEKQFLKVVREYDVPEKEKAALSLLQDIYVALNRPEAYFDLLGEIGMEIDQVTEDSLSYEAAYRSYEDSSFTIAAQSFKKYLEKFAHPQQETNALFYLASSYQRIGEQQNSIAIFEKLVSRPTNRFTEYAANIVSENAYNKKEYAKAIEFYQKLENNASYPENKLKAQIGLMRCYTFEKELGVAKIYANKVLVDPLSLDNVKIESNYVIGKAELEVDNFEEALIRFKEVSAKTSSAIGAESQYSIALIYHLQYEYKKSEESVRKLMKEKSGYDYWVAKGLILQAKNSIGMDDYVQAEYTINSVLKGYGVKDDGVIEEASDVLKRIQAHKNQEKDLKPGIENTIEIGDGND